MCTPPLLVHASPQPAALGTSVPPVPSPQSPPAQQCYPEAGGLEPGGTNADPGEAAARKKGGTARIICMGAKTEGLCHACAESEININLALDQELTDT